MERNSVNNGEWFDELFLFSLRKPLTNKGFRHPGYKANSNPAPAINLKHEPNMHTLEPTTHHGVI
jgi:hypothetical protein